MGDLPGEYSFSIAGQLSWVNLLYEFLSEAIVLPLFFFIGKVLTDKKEFVNRMRMGLIISVNAYMVLSFLIIALAKPLLSLMATDKAIIDASATYIRIESVASIFSLAFNFVMVGMVTLGKEKHVYILTAVKLVLCLLVDTFMQYVLNFSDIDKLFELVMVLLGFYMLYAFQNVFDSTFYGLGKTNYMLFESVVTNTIYYGGAFILYLCGAWTPSLIGIALLFGIGNAFGAVVSLVAYMFLLKKKNINILVVE